MFIYASDLMNEAEKLCQSASQVESHIASPVSSPVAVSQSSSNIYQFAAQKSAATEKAKKKYADNKVDWFV